MKNTFIDCDIIARTTVGEYEVSTVRTPKFEGDPDKFETVIFGLGNDIIWHATRESAKNEHRVIVQVLKMVEETR